MTRFLKMFAFIIFLLYTTVGFGQLNLEKTPQQNTQNEIKNGFVVYNANSFYAVQGTIIIHTKLKVFGTNDEQQLVCQSTIIQNDSLFAVDKKQLANSKKLKKAVCNFVKKQAVISKNDANNTVFNPFSNNQNNPNSIINTIKNVGIGTNNQLKNANCELQIANYNYNALQYFYNKEKIVCYNRNVDFGTIYSKTSRIRPPPIC